MEIASTNHKLKSSIIVTDRGVDGKKLLEQMIILQLKLEKKKEALTRTRDKLARARKNIKRLKGIVSYQRDRIIQLHT